MLPPALVLDGQVVSVPDGVVRAAVPVGSDRFSRGQAYEHGPAELDAEVRRERLREQEHRFGQAPGVRGQLARVHISARSVAAVASRAGGKWLASAACAGVDALAAPVEVPQILVAREGVEDRAGVDARIRCG